jgi:hypothetical protein
MILPARIMKNQRVSCGYTILGGSCPDHAIFAPPAPVAALLQLGALAAKAGEWPRAQHGVHPLDQSQLIHMGSSLRASVKASLQGLAAASWFYVVAGPWFRGLLCCLGSFALYCPDSDPRCSRRQAWGRHPLALPFTASPALYPGTTLSFPEPGQWYI